MNIHKKINRIVKIVSGLDPSFYTKCQAFKRCEGEYIDGKCSNCRYDFFKDWSYLSLSRKLRRIVLKIYGESCMRCGSTYRPEVDHIKPKAKYPLVECGRKLGLDTT